MKSTEVHIPISGEDELQGILTLPASAKSIVIFAHGSGSGRYSPRNQQVTGYLNHEGFATLLLDLLTPLEEADDDVTGEFRFNIPLLAERLSLAAKWCGAYEKTKGLKRAYFGASTGAAAALISAAELQGDIVSVVSRGGRPDLAKEALPVVTAPTLLIVGGHDVQVIELNQLALDKLQCQKKMEIVKGASHLFEEPGTLDQVARLAAKWFKTI